MSKVVKNLNGLKTYSQLRWRRQGHGLPSYFSSHSHNTFRPYSPHSFNWWFCCSEWPPSIMVRFCLVSKCKKAVMCLMEELPVLEFHVCMSYVAVGHKFNVRNQQYVLNTVSWSRNTPNIRYVWSAGKNIVDRSSQESNPVPHQWGNDSVLTNSVLLITLQSITTSKNKSRLYFEIRAKI